MAQREKAEESELQLTDPRSLTLCINNCESRPLTRTLTRPDPVRTVELEQREAAERTAGEVTRPLAAAAVVTKKVNRCLKCGKRVGLTGFRCRCGDLFCGDHRYSDRHECGYDYKAVERERIQRENPAVRAAKIVRI